MQMNYILPMYKQYEESVVLYLTEKDKVLGNGLQATAGMRRKNIAVAYDKKNYYLLNEENVVIYKHEKEYDDGWNETHYYCIKRSLTGYYILLGEGDCRISRPGKDDDYKFEKWVSDIIDENGKRIGTNKNVSKKTWDSYGCGKYPLEMGNGLICFENVFYYLESLKIAFYVSKKFAIKNIFENGLAELEFVAESKDYIIKIQKGKVVNKYNIDNDDAVMDILLETNDDHILYSIYPMTYSDHEKDELLSIKIKNLLYRKEKQISTELGKFCKYAKFSRFEFYRNTISDRFLTKERFIEGVDLINSEELQLINELYQYMQTNAKGKIKINNTFLFAKKDQYSIESGSGSDCRLFSGFFILIYCNDSRYEDKSLYRFYDYEGRLLSDAFYHKITYPIKDFHNDYYDFYSHVFIFHGRQDNIRTNGIINISNGKLEEFLFSNYCFLQDPSLQNKHSYIHIYNDCIEYAGCYYNFKGDKFPVQYVDVFLTKVVTRIIKKISPDFYFQRNRFNKFNYEPIVSNGVILLPNADCFESCIEDLRNFNKKRHSSISEIIHIGEYTSIYGDYSLYKVEYHPIAKCDINGVITLESNPAILKPLRLFDDRLDDLQNSQ